jgi:hypothetical protein
LTVAADAFQMEGVPHPAGLVVVDGVARLVRPLEHPETLATELEHLRHEGQAVEPTILVEGLQYFFLRTNFNPISWTDVTN